MIQNEIVIPAFEKDEYMQDIARKYLKRIDGSSDDED